MSPSYVCRSKCPSSSGGIKGRHAPSQRLCPPCPPIKRKKLLKSAIFGIFFNFCPLRYAFCLLDAPHEQFSSAATAEVTSLWQLTFLTSYLGNLTF